MTNLWRNTNITYATPWGLKSPYLQYSAISVRGKRLAARGGGGGLTAEERDALLKVPRREFMLTKEQKRRVLIGLVCWWGWGFGVGGGARVYLCGGDE